MAITFPTLAVDGQLWEMGGITYRYSATGDKWVALSSITSGGSGSVPVNDIYFGLVQFDANTGDLVVGRNDMFFANTSIDGRYLPLSGGQLSGPLLLANTSSGTNNEAISRSEMFLYVANVVATANDTYTVSAALDANGSLVYTLTDGSTYSVDIMTDLDARFVNVDGDTMTGPLVLQSDLTVIGNTSVSNFTANGTSTFEGDVYTNQNLFSNNITVSGDTTLSELTVTGNTSVTNIIASGETVVNNLTATGNTAVSNFVANGTSVFEGDVYTQQNLISNNITVSGDTIVNNLTATGNTAVTNFVANGTTVLQGDVYTEQNLYSNNITVSGDTQVNTFTANGSAVFEGDVFTQQNLYSNNITVSGDTIVNNITANGTSTFAGNTIFNQPVIFNANTVFNGSLTAQTVSIAMGDLVDANTTGVSNGQYLAWNGTEFAPISLPATAGIDTKISGLTFDSNTRILTASVSDGSSFTTTIPGAIDTNDFVNNVAFDPVTRLLTIGRTDGQVYQATIPDADEFVNVVTFDNTTRELTITRSDGNTFVSIIPETNLNGTVTNVTYDDTSRTLGVQKADGSSIAYLISEQDGQTISLSGNTVSITNGNSIDLTPILNVPHSIEDHTNVVISSATAGQVLTWDGLQWINTSLPPGTVDTFTNAGTLDPATGIITFSRSDGNQFNVDISAHKPSLTLGELTDVTITNPQNITQVLKYFNGTWMNMDDGVNITTNNSTVDMGLAFLPTGSSHTGAVLYNNKLLFNPTSGQLTLDGETITAAKIQAWDAASNTTFTETLTSLSAAGNVLTYTDENGAQTNIDLSLYLDDTNLARLVSGTVAANGIATFTRDDSTTFDVDFSGIASGSLNDLSDVVAANPAADQVLTWDATNSIWTAKSPADVTRVRNYVDNNNLWQHMLFVWNANSIEPLRTDGSGDFVYNPQKGQLRIAGNIVIDQGDSINELADVDTTTALPANGDVLAWDAVNSVWSPSPAATGGATTLAGLSDTWNTGSTPNNLSELFWNGTAGEWQFAQFMERNGTLSYATSTGGTPTGTGYFSGDTHFKTDTGTLSGKVEEMYIWHRPLAFVQGYETAKWVTIPIKNAIDDLDDVDTSTTAPTSGDVLSWNGTNWVPGASGGVPDGSSVADMLLWNGSSWYTAQASNYFDAGHFDVGTADNVTFGWNDWDKIRSFGVTLTPGSTTNNLGIYTSGTPSAPKETAISLKVIGNGGTINWIANGTTMNIKWENGTVPAAPGVGEEAVYIFTTTDSGANWKAALVGVFS